MKSTLLSLVAVFGAISHAQADQVSTLEEIPALVCASGDVTYFSMASLEKKIDKAELKVRFPDVYSVVHPRDSIGTRLDGCLTTDGFELKRVVIKRNGYSGIEVFDLATVTYKKVSGLSQALEGDPSKLDIVLRDEHPEYPMGLVLTNVVTSAGPAVAHVQAQLSANGEVEGLSGEAMVGTFVYGDSMTSGRCKGALGEVLESQFELGTAKLTVEACVGMGGGHTTAYEIYKVTVTDSNPEVPAAKRGQTVVLDEAALKTALTYHYVHHNGCDSMVLKVGELDAVYAVTTAENAGCGKQVPGAPVRNITPPNFDPHPGKSIYTVGYKGKKGKEQIWDRRHYLLSH